MIRKIFPVLADFLAVIGFVLALFISSRVFPNCDNTGFDYQAILVGVLSGLFTLLVGWNIYQMIDWKKKEKEVSELQHEMRRNINYIHNKTDYNQALVYGMISQSISSIFTPYEKEGLKYEMLLKGIVALKMFSKFPDCQKEMQTLMNSMLIGLKNSGNITLSDEIRTELLITCGEIDNRRDIESYKEFIALLKQA